ncbi:hypothetical protein [Nocardioides sp. SR21]|uniref:hypothetical protein n=1 Tax=Nocardioides sp. SR21 TaxID=2919501 RepID=UPI001FA981B6|nr:hypothetical protein [Nocardioides sp. SR21]
MNRLVNRVLIALAVPALLIPAASATAAGTAQVPSIDSVAKIYQHLEGGSAYESSSKVFGPGKKCKPGKAIKGASSRSATYNPDYSSGEIPDMTGETPMVSVTAMKFPSAKSAIAYLHGYDKSAKDCGPGGGSGGGGGGGGGPKCKNSMKKIAFKLGDERYGYQFKMKCKDSASVINTLFTRKGQFIVYANVMSMDASAPSIPKSVDLTELALKTVS